MVKQIMNLSGADALMSNGMAAWDFALSCCPKHAQKWITETAPGQFRLDVNVRDLQTDKIAMLKDATYRLITKHMPEWRQARWNEYAALYEKAQDGGKLSQREQMIFDAMIDPGETAESTYNEVLAALGWIHGCIAAHNAVEAAILALTDPVEIMKFDLLPDYPKWEGG